MLNSLPYRLSQRQEISVPRDTVFAFFSDPHNLERITPDWLHFEIVTSDPIEIGEGTQIEYRLRWRWLPMKWVSEIVVWDPPNRFVDVQLRGPYRSWVHEHRFTEAGRGTVIEDIVEYQLPLGLLSGLAHRAWIRRGIERIFGVRRRKIDELLSYGVRG